MADDLPGEQPVPLGDLEVAQRIASGARSGRPADRSPTLGQLLAAFAEPAPTDEARRRVRAALAMADVSTQPDVMDAAADDRVALRVAGAGVPTRRIVLGAAALVAVIGGAALAATMGGGGGGDNAADQLPLETTATTPAVPIVPTTQTETATTPTTPTVTSTTPTATSTTPTATTTTPASTETTTVGTTTAPAARTTATTPSKPAKPKQRRRKRVVHQGVSVILRPSQPTFLCAKDGTGRVLYAGTLSSERRFRARRIRLNVGLGPSTTVLVNGKPLALTGSPAGYDITRTKRVPLGSGQRPEC
jgi:hypothetical protein